MKLPQRFEELISRDQQLYSVVLKALSIVEPWVADNKTVFFYEYTDHSLKHLSEVLLSAEGLISDASWQHLTADDGALIVLSVLLHDCALHLTEDGFFSLIRGNYAPESSRYVGQEPKWPALWDQFFLEAKRFDQHKLVALFGNSEPVQSIPIDKIDFTLKHRLLIGEFLRRHHARLAHEIAILGIPGIGTPLPLADPEFRPLLDLAGFVARSHNLPIRTAVDALESTQRRVHLNSKVPFLMMVLRISDYLQIHSARAPGQLLRLRSLTSPVSRGEWRKHLSVREINQAHDDPEAIFVDAEPESATTFLAMRDLLRDIQAELDKSWAVLGEIYGRFTPLNSLGIAVRRIRSNLDDPEQFRKTRNPKYLPRDFRFRTASAELLDLLVAPLYGDQPEIGIRELLQNAVDACRERDDLIAKGIVSRSGKITDDVVVTLTIRDDREPTLIVEDYGVGMSPDIIEKYFLNIGAYFRSSDLWRKNHENCGHSTVHRTGRFGIGLLAAFLLGPEIRVTTRSILNPTDDAITFTCRQGAEVIEVTPCQFDHFGTRIEVKLLQKSADTLAHNLDEWDWYCLDSPQVQRVFVTNNAKKSIHQQYQVPACEENLESTKWRRILCDGYDDVFWSYEALERWGAPDSVVICNGIFISRRSHNLQPKISPELDMIGVRTPSLVVYDPDGRFPIDLKRNDVITNETGFKDALALDVSNYLVDHFIANLQNREPGLTTENVISSINPQILGLGNAFYRNDESIGKFILTKTGIIPCDAYVLSKSGMNCVLIDAIDSANNKGGFNSQTISNWASFYIPVGRVTKTKSSRSNFLNNSIGGTNYDGSASGYFAGLNIVGRRILVRKSHVTELVSPGNVKRGQWRTLSEEKDLGDWSLFSVGNLPALSLDVETVCAELDLSGAFGVTILYFGENLIDTPMLSPLAEVWEQKIGSHLLKQSQREHS